MADGEGVGRGASVAVDGHAGNVIESGVVDGGHAVGDDDLAQVLAVGKDRVADGRDIAGNHHGGQVVAGLQGVAVDRGGEGP